MKKKQCKLQMSQFANICNICWPYY